MGEEPYSSESKQKAVPVGLALLDGTLVARYLGQKGAVGWLSILRASQCRARCTLWELDFDIDAIVISVLFGPLLEIVSWCSDVPTRW